MAYFPYPESLFTLSERMKSGLIAISFFAMLSLISTLSLLCFIIYRLIRSDKYYSSPLRYNQSVMLIFCLILADFHQALAFVISIHWARKGSILAPTVACSVQAYLVQIGDVSSGLFSLSIAIQTFVIVVMRRKISHKVFVSSVIAVWLFCFALTIAGPLTFKESYFVRAGAWCWVNAKYDKPRLYFHYLWIFTSEFGSLMLYTLLYIILRRRVKQNSVGGVENRAVQRVARYMLLYPVVYTCLTLPLAAGRMASESGREFNDTFFLVAGSLITCCGWVDVLLYAITRQALVFENHSHSTGNDISLPALGYGTTTTVTNYKGPKASSNADDDSPLGSQVNIVKMERLVEVTVESRGDTSGTNDSGVSHNW